MKKLFVTGVDTDIGKTFVSLGLCLHAYNKGLHCGYFKPFQSGAYCEDNVLKAPDIVEISKYCDIPCSASYLLNGEVSPYLASNLNNVQIDLNKVFEDIERFSLDKDIVVIEGAGGLLCPVAPYVLFADFIKMLNIETVIVTTPKLGRINHTLMTLKCAQMYNINVKGVIINKVSKNPSLSEQYFIKELKNFNDIQILAQIPETEGFDKDVVLNALKDFNL